MFMVVFVIHDSDRLDEVLEAWNKAGVPGVTILASTGMARVLDQRSKALRDDLPLIPSLEDFLGHSEYMNRTLFTIVDNEEVADHIIAATESVLGDLDKPSTGIIAVLPVIKTKGLHRVKAESK